MSAGFTETLLAENAYFKAENERLRAERDSVSEALGRAVGEKKRAEADAARLRHLLERCYPIIDAGRWRLADDVRAALAGEEKT